MPHVVVEEAAPLAAVFAALDPFVVADGNLILRITDVDRARCLRTVAPKLRASTLLHDDLGPLPGRLAPRRNLFV